MRVYFDSHLQGLESITAGQSRQQELEVDGIHIQKTERHKYLCPGHFLLIIHSSILVHGMVPLSFWFGIPT